MGRLGELNADHGRHLLIPDGHPQEPVNTTESLAQEVDG